MTGDGVVVREYVPMYNNKFAHDTFTVQNIAYRPVFLMPSYMRAFDEKATTTSIEKSEKIKDT